MARTKRPRRIYRYDTEFKVKAVRLSQFPGALVKDVAESLDIHPYMLSKWRREYREEVMTKNSELVVDPQLSPELLKLRQLEEAHARLKEEYELLKQNSRFAETM